MIRDPQAPARDAAPLEQFEQTREPPADAELHTMLIEPGIRGAAVLVVDEIGGMGKNGAGPGSSATSDDARRPLARSSDRRRGPGPMRSVASRRPARAVRRLDAPGQADRERTARKRAVARSAGVSIVARPCHRRSSPIRKRFRAAAPAPPELDRLADDDVDAAPRRRFGRRAHRQCSWAATDA